MNITIKNNQIRVTCDCYPVWGYNTIPLTPVGANRYWIRKEPHVCQKHPGAHNFNKDDVLLVEKNGEYQFCEKRGLADTSTICERCSNPIPIFQHENLLGEIVCKACYEKIVVRIRE